MLGLPEIPAACLAERNIVLGRLHGRTLRLPDATLRLGMLPHDRPFDVAAGVEVMVDGNPLRIALGDFPLAGALSSFLPEDAGTVMPELLRALAVETLCGTLVDDIRSASGMVVSVAGLCLDRAALASWRGEPETTLSCRLAGPLGAPFCDGRLIFSQAALVGVARALAARPPSRPRLDRCIAMTGRVTVGRFDSDLAGLSGLEEGDVLLPDAVWGDPGKAVLVRFPGDLLVRGTVRGLSFVSLGFVSPSFVSTGHADGTMMDERDDLPVSDEAAHRLEALPVRLSFEIGEMQLSVAALREVVSGTVLDLERPFERLVTIRGNGAVIGMGELVRVGDRPGVRIVEWLASDA